MSGLHQQYLRLSTCWSQKKLHVLSSIFWQTLLMLLCNTECCVVMSVEIECIAAFFVGYRSICDKKCLLLLLSSSMSSSSSSSSVHSDLAGFQRGLVTDQSLLIYNSAQNFQIIWHILNVTALCIRIYRPGWRFCSYKLSCNILGIIPTLDVTSDTVQAAFIFCILLALLLGLYIPVAFWWWCCIGFHCWGLLHLWNMLLRCVRCICIWSVVVGSLISYCGLL
jgi:hypothetical protein